MEKWFDEDESAGRRPSGMRRNRRQGSVLSVTARGGLKRKRNAPRTVAMILVPLLAAALLFLGYRGVKAAGRALFAQNPRFTITRVQIHGGSEPMKRLAREYTQIREGMNLFAFDLGEVRRSILDRAPAFKSMEISRVLPGEVQMDIVERIPLVRMGQNSPLVADREGCIFAPGPGCPPLPVLVGYSPSAIQPRRSVEGIGRAALELLDVCDDPRVGLRVSEVRIKEDCLVLELTEEGRALEGKLAWDGMGQRTAASRQNLIDRLAWTKRMLDSEQGRELTQFDATLDGRFTGEPANAPPAAPPSRNHR